MKLFDKGKFFGKVNLVDIIIVIVIILAVVLGVDYFKKDILTTSGTEEIEYTIEIKDLSETTVKAIEEATNDGSELTETNRKIFVGKITGMSREEYYEYYFNHDKDEYVYTRIPDKYRVYLTITGNAEKVGDNKNRGEGYSFENQFEVKIGKAINITCKEFLAEGVIIKLNK